jgi:serine/threonine protein kinase/WD40 repeat protein
MTGLDEESVFQTARKIDRPDVRRLYLIQACGSDADLHARVVALLRANDEEQSFLERPAVTPFTPGPETASFTNVSRVSEEGPLAAAGAQIGPYKLTLQLGEGGMGTVYLAEQTSPVRRMVALKVIKPGMDSRQVVARFEAERQALALMDHVNIARVFDGGTTAGGRPYFVMELVRGVSITKYCDDHQLTPRQRLELFVPVCQAIQHAHQKGIIHRDIKPSNVLVTVCDGRPVPKVIDFGVAKATEQKLTDDSLITHSGGVIGTLEYMSPEQAEKSDRGIDTRSDVYSLGVLLYELLTGSTPLGRNRTKQAAYAEILRLIKEEEPPRPSTRLGNSGEALASISALRQTEPAKLTKLVRGELDWIVMKCLEKDRNRRYESAGAFATDVQRHLADEPVRACPPSTAYRLRKFTRRHKGTLAAASLLVFALLFGVVGTTWAMLRAKDAEAEAVNEAAQKTDALGLKEIALAESREQLFQALIHRARAERGSGRLGQRFEAIKAIRAAAAIRTSPELATEAMAALVLPDMEGAFSFERGTDAHFDLQFEETFRRFVRYTPEGGLVVCEIAGDKEKVVHHISPPTGFRLHSQLYSRDGRFLACCYGGFGTGDGKVQAWNLDGPEPAIIFDESPGLFEGSLAFHANGRYLAVGHADKTVSVFDTGSGRRVHRLSTADSPMHLAFHPRDLRLAVACGDAVQMFDLDAGRDLPTLRLSPMRPLHLSWHPDGRRLAMAASDRCIHLWDTHEVREITVPWSGHTVDGLMIRFSPSGDVLMSSDWSGQTFLWDVVSGRVLLKPWQVGVMQFSADGRLCGPVYAGDRVRILRLSTGNELRELRGRNLRSMGNMKSPVYHADGQTLLTTSIDCLNVFDAMTGEELGTIPLPYRDAARPVGFDSGTDTLGAPSGGWLTGGHSGLRFWPVRVDRDRPEVLSVGPPRLVTPDSGRGFSNGASGSADGRVVAVPQGDSTRVLRRDRPELRMILGPQFDVRHSAVSPDGKWVVTCSFGSDGVSSTVRVWDAHAGVVVRDLESAAYTSAVFSSDNRWLVTNTFEGSRQWDVGTWNEVRRYKSGDVEFSPGIAGVVFSPDSRLLAMRAEPNVIRLLESQTGREVGRLTGPTTSRYTPVCFSPDGTRLVAVNSGETAVFVWDLRRIRAQLKDLGLDWDWPEFPNDIPRERGAAPTKVEVLLGEFQKPVMTAVERARQSIERLREVVRKDPDNAGACNDLAWFYATAPEPYRDVKAALPLAENAVRMGPKNPVYRNTMGVVYYRIGRYREAAELLSDNLRIQQDAGLPCDLYFLALSLHHLGEPARAKDYFDLAERWRHSHRASPEEDEELTAFRGEAAERLGVKEKTTP